MQRQKMSNVPKESLHQKDNNVALTKKFKKSGEHERGQRQNPPNALDAARKRTGAERSSVNCGSNQDVLD